MTERLAHDAAAIRRAADLIRSGGLVAFPTETVYGLGARADDSGAVQRIFAAKGRPPGNPLIVHVADAEAARALAEAWPDAAARFAAAFWPGPLTLVIRRRAGAIAPEVTAGGATAAVRVPEHPVARALLDAARLPIAAPSANRSSAISPTTADHVLKSLGGRVDLVLDGGPTGYGIESSIVDVTRDPAVLLRHGAIPIEALAGHAAIVDRGGAVVALGERAEAPGAHARHYAPNARVILVPAADVTAEVAARRARGERVGVLERSTFHDEAERGPKPGASIAVPGEGPREVLPDEPAGYARGLYAALHRLEDEGCEVLVIADVPADPAWAAVRDRLRRASA